MAAQAHRDMESRKITVGREKLLATLRTNKQQHIKDYEAAVSGYKETLRGKIVESFDAATAKLAERRTKMLDKVAVLTDDEITKQSARTILVDTIYVDMPVPKSYADEYDMAISIAEWTEGETMELSYSEFVCFVRDEWEWSAAVAATNSMYALAGR